MKSVQRIKNTLSDGTRAWLQLVTRTVTIGVGKLTLDNKRVIPESWIVGHLPVYLSIGRDTICLTDLTEDELNLFKEILNKAYDAALPICQALDEMAFEALQRGEDLELVPNRALRGAPPSFMRDVKTKFDVNDLPEDDRDTVVEYLRQIGVS